MASQQITPPPLQSALPTAKEKKYDRQLRLWAASGQAALEDAKLLLLNAGPGVVGIETLKNLILPGVGSFTIVDGETVTERDLGINFFLTEESLGKSRAEETGKYLNELNPDVNSHAIHKSISDFVKDERWWSSYTLILLIGPSKLARDLCTGATERSIPLFYIHSIGFYSHFSVQLPKRFPIVDTHPDPTSIQDLRLLDPWPELESLQKKLATDLTKLDDHEHGHVPYLVILLHYLDEWRQAHDGNPPLNYKEKKEFKALVESGARTSNLEGGEENFVEGASAVLKSLNPASTPSGLREVFEDSACDLQDITTSFWPIAAGIREFYRLHNGLLPLPGAIPDMKAQSSDYIRLQNIYKQKARDDLREVSSIIHKNRSSTAPSIPETEIEAFCKNAAHVKLVRGSSIQIWAPNTEPPFFSAKEKKHLRQLAENPDSLFPVYLAFQVYEYFSSPKPSNEHRIPSLDTMIPFALHRIDEILGKSPAKDVNPTSDDAEKEVEEEEFDVRAQTEAVLKELNRAGGGELHNIAALTGGMVAQEVIKVLTKQYVPVDNVCVFDGVRSKTAVFKI